MVLDWCRRTAPALLTVCALSLVPVAPALATPPPGSLDTRFGNRGFVTLALGAWAGAAAVVVQPDGKIVSAGEANVGGHNVMVATRITRNGAFDRGFGGGGVVTVNIGGGAGVESGAALALQRNGRIVMVGAGEATRYGPLHFAAVRLLRNGHRDRSFGHDGVAIAPVGATSIANAVVVAPDGAIVLAGTALLRHIKFAAARLTPKGRLDRTFGHRGTITLGPTGGAWGMVALPGGKVVLAGQAAYDNPLLAGAQQFMAARLTARGRPDGSFGRHGVVLVPVGETALGFGVALRNDGKLVLAGPAFTDTGVNATVRLNPDGSRDPTYGVGGIATIADWNGVNGITLGPHGEIVLPAVGASAIVLNPNGSPDGDFGQGGIAAANVPSGGANGAALQPDGKIVLAGAAKVGDRIVLTVIRLNGERRSARQ